jgi:DNA polymerase III epsilon subunit-like protein
MNEGHDKNIVCKVTVVNERGEVILDTLIKQEEEEIKKSHFPIHGIANEHLDDAPAFEDVRRHLLQICEQFEYSPDSETKKKVTFIGHSVKHDLTAMSLPEVQFIDTQRTHDQMFNARKLKDLAKDHLNAQIQEGIHSSVSIIINIITL